jgi:DNA-binding transcriptional LysR family regulator
MSSRPSVAATPHLTLRALEIFLAVAEAGSMVGAAKRLGTSTSAISQQITNLESGLEVVLFDRALRPMGLTPAGLLLQHHAVGILDGVDRARAALVDMRLGALPSLRLAIIDSLDAGITPRLVAGLSEEHPETRITAWSGRSEEHRKALSDRLVDVIVTSDPMEDVERLERHRLMVEPFILIAAKGLYDPGAGIPWRNWRRGPSCAIAAACPWDATSNGTCGACASPRRRATNSIPPGRSSPWRRIAAAGR